ncbi:sugar ABC transporter permease [Streptococcus pasteurianus]|uniref:carbohydrate ABC transporter permease n=1 Tax=Streptococcus TaxID=1301 RepID=UPI000E3F1E30|nr:MULTISPECIES: sugar ABC transporter permease [Streptococcus]MCH1618999.1 sugar ABC transporter permease [Streptococcus gallolyticus]MCI7515784.1 sugar ABC transporter permease [Streptococcus sp.]MCO7183540.1 sugar ABC transporter permease [Streptococcus gallolyticus]MDV5118142.1 sugar ABC transporter permease [Streptococcus pasteurianus]MDV5123827.1 sugar ABC transporter permease [Streptococcus pasteurianus]
MKSRNIFSKKWVGHLFIIFPTLLIVVFYFYPMVQSFIMSLKSGSGVNLSFVGFANYQRLLTDKIFLESLWNTLLFLLVQVPVMLGLSIFFSVLLNEKTLRWKGMFRTLFFLPSVTSLVAYSIVFKYLFSNDGVINNILSALHLISSPIMWLSDSFWSKLLIIIAITWRWTGYNMIFFLSALQNIDPQIYEAAEMDGANSVKKFFSITIPMLKPVILFSTITSTIGTLQLFAEPMNITDGGPAGATMTISQYIYNISFKYTPDFGYASAISYVIVILVIIFSIIQSKVGTKDV